MPILGFFPGGGMDTSDATATAADIRAGLTAYTADGLTTGTLTIKEARGTVSVGESVATVALDFKPLAVMLNVSGSTNPDNCVGAFLVLTMNTDNKGEDLFRVFQGGSGQRPSTDFAPNGNGFNVKSIYGNFIIYQWYAIGL